MSRRRPAWDMRLEIEVAPGGRSRRLIKFAMQTGGPGVTANASD